MASRIVGLMLVFLGVALAGATFMYRAVGPLAGIEVPRWPLWAGLATAAIGLVIAMYGPSSDG